MKNGLTYLKLRTSMQSWGISPMAKLAPLSDMPSKPLISMWKAHVLKHNPTIRPALAHRIAFEIVTRPAYISYMTAYRTAVMDLGVK